ncbi:MAG: isoaspartyl peptidase/L-asparaginase [Mariniblastus sp.]|nr:isoaspartyl peptidase/L-asparaginase [Mariniblastus sp.]
MIPKLIIHGGAGRMEGRGFSDADYCTSLDRIVRQGFSILQEHGARVAVLNAIRLLESDTIFNAGTGSKLQRDGQVRMSAALIDSTDGIFSGVANIRNVEHPIDVADLLRSEDYHVLDGGEAMDFARQKGIPYHNPTTAHRLKEYREGLLGETGTVGAVALDSQGTICAGTSTGGVGFELPGRLGDTATVAGTYASHVAAVSCTGKGEDIVNLAVAARIVTRVQDGIELREAVQKLIDDANEKNCSFGLISLDAAGNFVVGNTQNIRVLYSHNDGQVVKMFSDS